MPKAVLVFTILLLVITSYAIADDKLSTTEWEREVALLIEQGKYEEATAKAEARLEGTSLLVQARAQHLLADVAQTQGKHASNHYAASIALYNKALTGGEDLAQALMGRGWVRTQRNIQGIQDAKFGVEDLEKSIARDPRLPGAHLALGIALRTKDKDRAKMHFEKALELDPKCYRAMEYLHYFNMQPENCTNGLELLDKAVALGSITALKWRAQLRFLTGRETYDPKKGQEDIEAAISKAPERYDLRYWWGVKLKAEDRPAEAKEQLEQALKLAPEIFKASIEHQLKALESK